MATFSQETTGTDTSKNNDGKIIIKAMDSGTTCYLTMDKTAAANLYSRVRADGGAAVEGDSAVGHVVAGHRVQSQ